MKNNAGMFSWNGLQLEYFDHAYNHTARNMRRVEIPIARWFVAQCQGLILEVGNVLAHYGHVPWPAVDIREPGAINADVMRWKPYFPVDLLVSISTIEHIGFGKFSKDTPTVKPSQVLARFKSFLAPHGMAVVTAPTAYNPALDDELRGGTLGAGRMWFMRLVGQNEWEECSMADALAMPPRASSGRWSGGLMVLVCDAH